jgi:hypothetical protein
MAIVRVRVTHSRRRMCSYIRNVTCNIIYSSELIICLPTEAHIMAFCSDSMWNLMLEHI